MDQPEHHKTSVKMTWWISQTHDDANLYNPKKEKKKPSRSTEQYCRQAGGLDNLIF